jgi:microcystin degradation protein MlrC
MRIAIAGFGAENSTFAPHRMTMEHFDVRRGDELLALYDLAEWGEGADVEWIPVMRAHAGAGGAIETEAYDAIVDEIVGGIRAAVAEAPIDAVYVDLHGAAFVIDRPRAEERLLRGIREAVGDAAVISMSMDTHGNFSRELAELVDLALCFRHAPHTDAWATRERAVRKLMEVLRRGSKPVKAWVRVPILLPGERTSTLVEPGRSTFGEMLPTLERFDVVDVSMWVGFFWADEDRNGAAVMVTGYDEAQAVAAAAHLAEGYWRARHGFEVVAEHSGQWSDALDFALERAGDGDGQLWISDSGDNVTAGATGDTTFALTETLARPDVTGSGLRILFAGLTDPASLAAAAEAGLGATVRLAIGAIVDDRFAGPVERDWEVVRLVDGLYDGEGVTGAVLADGDVHVLVQGGRAYFVPPAVIGPMTGRKLPGHAFFEPDGYDVVVVKVGYLFPGQIEAAGTWFMAITPGGTDLDVGRLGFEHVDRPIYPLDAEFEPDLTPIVLETIVAAGAVEAVTEGAR